VILRRRLMRMRSTIDARLVCTAGAQAASLGTLSI
jgi:hypothetical protein